jgi:hypothetical protein
VFLSRLLKRRVRCFSDLGNILAYYLDKGQTKNTKTKQKQKDEQSEKKRKQTQNNAL